MKLGDDLYKNVGNKLPCDVLPLGKNVIKQLPTHSDSTRYG